MSNGQPVYGISWSGPVSGSALTSNDYYLLEDAKYVEIRAEYVKHVSRMLQMLGDDEASATAAAEKILAMETTLVTPQYDKVQSRNMDNFNNYVDNSLAGFIS